VHVSLRARDEYHATVEVCTFRPSVHDKPDGSDVTTEHGAREHLFIHVMHDSSRSGHVSVL
jgi:hypothetical protein